MKSTLVVLLLALSSSFSYAQYLPPTVPETVYAILNDAQRAWNVGTDTRAADPGDHETSPMYLNYLNVTVSDHPEIGGFPKLYWRSSSGGIIGSHNLPMDAVDPDVVLLDNADHETYAIVVYHSNAFGGYVFSYCKFLGSSFGPLSMPVLLEPYINPPIDQIYINIDSDESGHFAVVYQKGATTICKTGAFPAGSAPPPIPGTPKIYNGLIQPDVAIQHTTPLTATKVKIIGLTTDRSKYSVYMQNIAGTLGYSYTSPAYPISSLNNPRIACPYNTSAHCAITLMKNIPSSGLYDIMVDVFGGSIWYGIRTVNNGSLPGFPSAINQFINKYPALCVIGNNIVLGWHTSFLPGPPTPQNMTFVGLDINASTLSPLSGDHYVDICPAPYVNATSTIAIAGRYTQWGKTAAYERTDTLSAQSGTRLVYSLTPISLGTWSGLSQIQTGDNTPVLIYPNPAKAIIHVQLPETNTHYTYTIFDMLGKRMLTGDIDQHTAQIGIEKLPAGNYTLMLESEFKTGLQKLQFVKQ